MMEQTFEETLAENLTISGYGLHEYMNELWEWVLPVVVFIGCSAFFSVIGNLYILFLFIRHYRPCNFRYFAICLCVVGLVGGIMAVPFDIVLRRYYYMFPNTPLCKLKHFMTMFVILADVFVLAAICLDRYRKVCRPLHWQIRKHGAFIMSIGIFVLSAILSIPSPIFVGNREGTLVLKNKNITLNVSKCDVNNEFAQSKLPSLVLLLGYILLTVVQLTMIVLYVLITKTIIQHMKEAKKHVKTIGGEEMRKKISPANRRSIISITLTAIFIVTNTIYIALVDKLSSSEFEEIPFQEYALFTFFFKLHYANYAVNPIVFGILDPSIKGLLLGSCKNVWNVLTCKKENGLDAADGGKNPTEDLDTHESRETIL